MIENTYKLFATIGLISFINSIFYLLIIRLFNIKTPIKDILEKNRNNVIIQKMNNNFLQIKIVSIITLIIMIWKVIRYNPFKLENFQFIIKILDFNALVIDDNFVKFIGYISYVYIKILILSTLFNIILFRENYFNRFFQDCATPDETKQMRDSKRTRKSIAFIGKLIGITVIYKYNPFNLSF